MQFSPDRLLLLILHTIFKVSGNLRLKRVHYWFSGKVAAPALNPSHNPSH
jgi:hypothetical protein